MNRFTLFASALTISTAGLASSAAYADCAADLASMRTETAASSMPKDQGTMSDTSTTASGTMALGSQASGSMGSDTKQATGELSGVAPTAQVGQVAGGATNPSQADKAAMKADEEAKSANASSSNSSTSDDSNMTTASTTSDGGKNAMVSQHLAAAQTALDSGNEQACMDALKAAKSSM